MFVVSFYSYKGGVGRTMTLLNVAWQLAEDGHRVALLDLDLEAPGLHHARLEEVGDGHRRPTVSAGFRELTNERDNTDFARYVTGKLGPEGRISLVAASSGDAEGYARWLQAFSWREFYPLARGGRARVEGLLAYLGQDHEYLLVDGRTGHTDVASVTLRHLPDAIVFVTNLTEQSMQGVVEQLSYLDVFNEKLRNESQSIRRAGRERTEIRHLLVASQLPHGEWQRRQAGLAELTRRAEQPPDVEIDHLPALALDETVQIVAPHLGLDPRGTPLPAPLRPYRQLVDRLYEMNASAPENLLRTGEALLSIGRWREALIHFQGAASRAQGIADVVEKAGYQSVRAALRGLDWKRAQAGLNNLDASHTPPQLHLEASWTTLLLQDLTASVAELRKALGSDDPHPGVDSSTEVFTRYFLGDALMLLGVWQEAEKILAEGLQLAERCGELPLMKGMFAAARANALLALGKIPEVEAELQPFLDGDRLNLDRDSIVYGRLLFARAELRFHQGKTLAAVKDEAEARRLFVASGDRVALLYAVLLHAALHGHFPAATEKPWVEIARDLDLPRVRALLVLWTRAWGGSEKPLSEEAAWPSPEIEGDDELDGLCLRDALRVCIKGGVAPDRSGIGKWLARPRDDEDVYLQTAAAEVRAFLALATRVSGSGDPPTDPPADSVRLPAPTRALVRAITAACEVFDKGALPPDLAADVRELLDDPTAWCRSGLLQFLDTTVSAPMLTAWAHVRGVLA